ncbi:MAG: hypothetical protein EHM72_02155 [Calditrichaeota bacterium]|nr:MAG: hypothetical protein EHM72_02155 [Calditrichota bacterium]
MTEMTHLYKIHSYETDVTGKARVTSLLNYMQESAWNHAEALNVGYSHLIEKKLVWVLARLRLKIFQFPQWGDTVTLKTWPSGYDRLCCFRDFLFTNSQMELAHASSTWIVVDLVNRRPQRTESYINLDVEHPPPVFAEFVPKIGAIEAANVVSHTRVQYSDLDVNSHVNNVKYIEFLFNSFSEEFLSQHRLEDLTVNYMNEALLNDEISIRTHQHQDHLFFHLLTRGKDKVEILRAQTNWQATK